MFTTRTHYLSVISFALTPFDSEKTSRNLQIFQREKAQIVAVLSFI